MDASNNNNTALPSDIILYGGTRDNKAHKCLNFIFKFMSYQPLLTRDTMGIQLLPILSNRKKGGGDGKVSLIMGLSPIRNVASEYIYNIL